MPIDNDYKVRFADAMFKLYAQECQVTFGMSVLKKDFNYVEVSHSNKDHTRVTFHVIAFAPIPDAEGILRAMVKISESLEAIESVTTLD